MQVAKGMKVTGKGIEGKERKSEVSSNLVFLYIKII